MRTRRRCLPEPVLDSDDSQSDDEPLPPARKRQRKTKAQLAAEAAAAAEAAEAPGTAAVASALRAQAMLGEPEPAGEPKPGIDADGGDSSSSSSGEGEGEAVQPPPTPQQAIAAAQEAAARAKEKPTKRMCASWARDAFALSDRDLALLVDVHYQDNPHHACAAPMRLYLVHELQALSANKAARKAWDKAHAAERAAATAAAFKAKKAAAAAEAAAALARMGGAKASQACQERYGSVSLPESCLERIMTHLATLLEPGGLRGPSHVAGVIGNASLVCWDFYHAAKAGWAALASEAAKLTVPAPPAAYQSSKKASPDKYAKQVQLQVLFALPGPADTFPGGWDWWDKAVSSPAALTLPQLKAAARHFKQQVTGTKAELILRVLAGFGLRAPSAAPAQLLRALRLERAAGAELGGYLAWDGGASSTASDLLSLLNRLTTAGTPGAELQAAQLAQAICNEAMFPRYHYGYASGSPRSSPEVGPGSLARLRATLLRHWAGLPELRAAASAAQAVTECREREQAQRAAEAARRFREAQAAAAQQQQQQEEEACRQRQQEAAAAAAGSPGTPAHTPGGMPAQPSLDPGTSSLAPAAARLVAAGPPASPPLPFARPPPRVILRCTGCTCEASPACARGCCAHCCRRNSKAQAGAYCCRHQC